MIVALALSAALGAGDPLPAIAERVARGDHAVALELTRAALASAAGAGAGRPLGLRYLEGRLTAELGDPHGARGALLRSLAEEPSLAPWARQEIAELTLAAGDAEAAASDLLVVVATSTDRRLRDRALLTLRRCAERGGGCRTLLASASRPLLAPLSRPAARRLELLTADCELAAGQTAAAGSRWQTLLGERDDDVVAQEIVDRVGRREMASLPLPALPVGLLGRALARQRDFTRAIPVLERAVATTGKASESSELALTLARSRFWSGDPVGAAVALEALAAAPGPAELRAEALFYAARARELEGDTDAALADYRAAETAATKGGWADSARLGVVRLEQQNGRDLQAFTALGRISSGVSGASARARALLFLSVSDLLAGRTDRARSWLARVRQGHQVPESEVAYWQGRAAELAGDPKEAVERYRQAVGTRPYRPFAAAAAGRLRTPALRPLTVRVLERLERGPLSDRLSASVLRRSLGLPDAESESKLAATIAADPKLRRFALLAPAPVGTWPLWSSGREDGPTLLLRLGLWRDGAAAARRSFAAPAALALAAAEALAAAGDPASALRLAEGVAASAPRELPESLWPDSLRRLLGVPPYRALLLEATARHPSDPALLAAILREESAFEAAAYSPAAARGLGQFTLPTARRLAPAIGKADLAASDLERPEIAIELAAAHLAELDRRFEGRPELVVAAYNAGEAQVEAWLRLCRTEEAEEFLSKVAFRETRAYLGRVLESRARFLAEPTWQLHGKP